MQPKDNTTGNIIAIVKDKIAHEERQIADMRIEDPRANAAMIGYKTTSVTSLRWVLTICHQQQAAKNG